jgi:sec-independent protein translocase protein TatB
VFDLSFSELLVIGVVALIVIGPKEIPGLFRTMGRFTAKLRGMAREFSRAMEQAADETGVKDIAKDLKTVANPRAMGLDAVKDAASRFEKWDPLKPQTSSAPKTPAASSTPTLASTPTKSTVPEPAAAQPDRKALAEAAAEQVRAAAPAEPPKGDA